jgi:methionyl aminopeptidase
VNEEIVHGFPSDRELQEGDIVSLDVGVKRKGFFSDAAKTFAVGEVGAEANQLVRITQEALAAGIENAIPGKRLRDISCAVRKVVEQNGFSVIKRFVGHGIGESLHEKPEVPNYDSAWQCDVELMPGMCLAIEPMVAAGDGTIKILDDGWTAVTRDSSLAAHFENTVALTRNGPEILSADT